jgi:hypothetical protein
MNLGWIFPSIQKSFLVWGCSSVVEYSPSMHEALDFISSTEKNPVYSYIFTNQVFFFIFENVYKWYTFYIVLNLVSTHPLLHYLRERERSSYSS